MTPKSNALAQYSQIWQKIVEQIFHIFVNKVAVLRKKQKFLQRMVPSLVKGYHLAVEHKLMAPEIDQRYLDDLDNILNLAKETEPLAQTINSTLSLLNQLVRENVTPFSVCACINKVLHTYPLTKSERLLIEFNETEDFALILPEVFLSSLIIELIYFAFHTTRTAYDPVNIQSILITLSRDKHQKTICIETITLEENVNYNHLLNKSLTVSEEKITPGINFCCLGILSMGGEIIFNSDKKQSMKTIIRFPIDK